MIIYLVGPSGVGKSNAVSLLRSEHQHLTVVDIDDEFRGHEFEWHTIEPRLAQLQSRSTSSGIIVVDVGAGTQTLPQLSLFLKQVDAQVVLVTAPPEEVILRQPVPGRSLAEFCNTEYVSRQALFALAVATVDVRGQTKEEAGRRIADRIVELLNPG